MNPPLGWSGLLKVPAPTLRNTLLQLSIPEKFHVTKQDSGDNTEDELEDENNEEEDEANEQRKEQKAEENKIQGENEQEVQ